MLRPLCLAATLLVAEHHALACSVSVPNAPFREERRLTTCSSRCEAILRDLQDDAQVSFRQVLESGQLALLVVDGDRRLLAGTLDTRWSAVVPRTPLTPGRWALLVNAERRASLQVSPQALPVPHAPADVTLSQMDGDTDPVGLGACPWAGAAMLLPPPPPPALFQATRHHLAATIPQLAQDPSLRADVWILEDGAPTPTPVQDAFSAPPDGVFFERTMDLFGTSGVAEDPGLASGKTFRIAVRLVNGDGMAGPITVSEPVTITEKGLLVAPMTTCAHSGQANAWWAGAVMALAWRRRQARNIRPGHRLQPAKDAACSP